MYTNTSVLCENLPKSEQSQKLNLYHMIGFQTLFINLDYVQNKEYLNILQEIQSQTNLEVYGKITLYPNDIKHLKTELRSIKKLDTFFIAVQSTNKDVLTFAVNDSRVNCISCPKITNLKYITPGVISLIKTNQKFIEISLRDVILSKTHERSRVFHNLSKFLNNMHTYMNSVIYGGWEENILEIIGPYEIKAIFSAIFDLPDKISNSIVKTNPQKVLNQLKNAYNSCYIQEGVRIISDNS